MGKKIDRIVLDIAVAAAFYFYFQRAFGNRLVSAALSLLCLTMLRRVLRTLLAALQKTVLFRRRNLRRNARSAIMRLACMDAEAAQSAVEQLVRLSYGESARVVPVQRHPSSTLSADSLFDLWRQNQDQQRLVICASCKADPDCRALADQLKAPRVAVIDAPLLAQLISEHPDVLRPQAEESVVPRPRRASRILHLLLRRQNAPRCLIVAASMFLIYLLCGSVIHLALSLTLLLAALISLRTPPRPARLF